MGSTFKNNSISVQPLDCSFIATDYSIIPTKGVWNLKQTAKLEQIVNCSVAFSQPTELLGFRLFATLTFVIFGSSILITEYMSNRSKASGQGSVTETASSSPNKSISVKDTGSSDKGKGPKKAGGAGDGDDGEKKKTFESPSLHRTEFMTLHELQLFLAQLLNRTIRSITLTQFMNLMRSVHNPDCKKLMEDLGIRILSYEQQSIYRSTGPSGADNLLIIYTCRDGVDVWVGFVQHNGMSRYEADFTPAFRQRVAEYLYPLFSYRGSIASAPIVLQPGEGPSGQISGPWLQDSAIAAAAANAARPPLHPQQLASAQGLAVLSHALSTLTHSGSAAQLPVNIGGATALNNAPQSQVTDTAQATDAGQGLVNAPTTGQSVAQSQANSQHVQGAALSSQSLLDIASALLAAGGGLILLGSLAPGLVTFSRRGEQTRNRQLGRERGARSFHDSVVRHNSQLHNILNQIKVPSTIPFVPSQTLAIEHSQAFQEGQDEGFLETQRNFGRQHSNQRTRISRLNQFGNSLSSGQRRPPTGVSPTGVTIGLLAEIFASAFRLITKTIKK